jgi:Sugar-transfer associated ATP-grasp
LPELLACVDFVLDRSKGPLIRELNARPGLNVQIANRAGLLPRLKLLEPHREELGEASEHVAFARSCFAYPQGDDCYQQLAELFPPRSPKTSRESLTSSEHRQDHDKLTLQASE